MGSCQLNDSLKVLIEGEKVTINKPVEKKLERNNSIKPKKNIERKDKDKDKDEVYENKINKKELALIQPKIKRKEIKEKLIQEELGEKELIKKVGLLIPITGKYSFLGKTLIDTTRLYLLENSADITFKVFDTGSTPFGADIAFKNGLNEGFKVFIGPIFSEATFLIQQKAREASVVVFSLSTDKNAVSKNIIISGLSLEDEISCIVQRSEKENLNRLGVIFNDNKYGELLKKTILKITSESKSLSANFFNLSEVDNLDEEIKKFSNYNERKVELENEINRVKDLNITQVEKDKLVESLVKKETFGDLPFDFLIVAEGGSKLIEILALLSYYDIDASNTDIYGTSIWEGLEKYKEDLLDKTFYSTSLDTEKDNYKKMFSSFFLTEPSNLNFVMRDIVKLIENNSFDFSKISELTDNKISREGFLKRDVFIYQNKRGKLRSIFSCKSIST